MPLLTLSDGRTIGMPANASQQDYTNATNLGEAQIAADYGAQAQRQNAPVVDRNGTYVYSATNRYSNNWLGHAGAWADHNVPGMMTAERWLHSAGLDAPVGQPGGGLAGVAGRVGTGAALYGTPVVGQLAAGYDVGANAYNALKSAAGIQGYEAPTAYGTATKALGVPQADPNASTAQQVAEAVLTGAPGAKSLMGALVRPTAAVVAGDVGQKFGEAIDPRFGRLGALAGTFSPAGVEAAATGRIPRSLAGANVTGRTAADTQAAADALGVTPSFMSLANLPGKRMAKSLSGWWGVGTPLARSNQALEEQLLGKQRQAADEIATQAGGAPITPAEGRLGADEGFIGQHLIDGARAASRNIRQAMDNKQEDFANQIHAAGPTSEVSVSPIRATMNAYMADPKNGVTTQMRDMINQHLDAMENSTRGTGAQPNAGYEPGWNVQGTDTLPWAVMKNTRKEVRDALSSRTPGQATPGDRLLGTLEDAITDSMTTTADRVSPGMGQEFRDMSADYARNKNQVLPVFDRIGGKPATYNGITTYSGGKSAGEAYNELANPTKQAGLTDFIKLASDNAQGPNPMFPLENWAQAAGGFVSKLGEGKNASWRSDNAGTAWSKLGTDVKSALTLGPNGQPLQAGTDLDNLARVGAETVVPQRSSGLTEHTASLGSAVAVSEMVTKALQHIFGAGAMLATGGLGRVATQRMESPGFKEAMTAPGTSLSDAVYSAIPSSAITMNQLYPPSAGAPTPASGAVPVTATTGANPNPANSANYAPPASAPLIVPVPAPSPVPAQPYTPSAAFSAAYPVSQ